MSFIDPRSPGPRSRVLADQEVRGVGARELRHQAASVLRSVVDGERVLATRHGEPQAVLLSVRDAIEALVEPELAASAESAVKDLEDGQLFAPWQHAGPVRPVLARAAAERYRMLGGLARGDLRMGLCRGDADERRPLWLSHGKWLAPFSYHGDGPRLALAHDLIEVRALERELFGEEIFGARQRRDTDRRMHARTRWHRAPR